MKIFIHYKITDKPWGGGNSFLKAFKKYCLANNIELADSVNEDCDVVIFNACHRAPGKFISIDELINLKVYGYSRPWLGRFLSPRKKVLVYRSDGFRVEYAEMGRNKGDEIQSACLHLADHVIFQNENCLKVAREKCHFNKREHYSIVHNGVDHDLFTLKQTKFWDGQEPIKVFSANWSSNLNKGYEIIAAFSELEGVESYFCGNWPESINKKQVKISSPMPQHELAKEYHKYDIFLHPSIYDQSPNVCLEAVSSGLPFIYHPTSGIEEVAGEFGIALNESDLGETLTKTKKRYFDIVEKITAERESLSMEKCAKQYIDIFKSILNLRQ